MILYLTLKLANLFACIVESIQKFLIP